MAGLLDPNAYAEGARAVSVGELPSSTAANVCGEALDNAAPACVGSSFDDRAARPAVSRPLDGTTQTPSTRTLDEETVPGSTRPIAAPLGRTPLGATRFSVAALRRATPLRMWGGKGCGLPCDFCRVVVGPDDVEYEVEAELDGGVVMLRFHYRCHYAWTGGEEPRVAADRA